MTLYTPLVTPFRRGRIVNPKSHIRIARCQWCGRLFQVKRRAAYCSSRCRSKWLEVFHEEAVPYAATIELDAHFNPLDIERE